MPRISVRTLRATLKDVLDRVATGQEIIVERNGRPSALITPLSRRRRRVAQEYIAPCRLSLREPGRHLASLPNAELEALLKRERRRA